jgi:phosphatidate cytidylyltransferase
MKRIATALILIPLISYVAVGAPFLVFALVLGIVAALCFWEFSDIAAGHGIKVPRIPGIVAGLVVLFAPPGMTIAVLLTLAAMVVAMSSSDLGTALPRAAAMVLGILYVFGCWHAAIDLRAIQAYWLLFALALNWIGDTAAMVIGRAYGRHKLAPRVSPAKSWEGAFASVIASVIFGVLFLHWAIPQTPMWLAALAAGIGNIAGQLGDLSESAMKRGAGMKDSGTLLPGHGGWLDRVDSSLFSVPVVFVVLNVVEWIELLRG